MKVEIKAHLEFSIQEENDLYTSIQINGEDFVIEELKFEEILKQQIKGLRKADKQDCLNRILKSVKKFQLSLEGKIQEINKIKQ